MDHIGWGAALPPQPDEGLVEGHQGGRLLLILVSVVLMLVVTIGGWEKLAGAKPLQIAYIVVYLVLAFFIARWARGGLRSSPRSRSSSESSPRSPARAGSRATSRGSRARRSTSPSSASSPS